jgi:CBS domain-containing protein
LDEDERLVGVVSEKDLFRILYPFYTSYYDNPEMYTDFEEREGKPEEIRNKKVEVFMKRDVFTIGPNEPALKAGALMLARSTDRLTVMENGKPIGTLYRKNIYKAILEKSLGLK